MSGAPPSTELRDAALAYGARGWPVFPIKPGTKVPATEHGFHDATTDATQIRAWWAENPDYNIAFSPHTVGLSIVDLDGPEAETNWAGLQLVHGDVQTYEVETPRGRHLYFVGELPPTQSKLAPHIDTRGRGSYALLPPSTVGGRTYREASSLTAAPVPEWVSTPANAKRERAKSTGVGLDLPVNVERARSYLRTAKPAVEGQMGNKQTFVTACDLANLGVSEDTAQQLMLEIYNPRCVPPWEPEELETVVSNGFSYAQNEAGSWATEPAGKVFAGEVLGKLLADSAPLPVPEPHVGQDDYPAPMSAGELIRGHFDPPKFLIDGMLLDDGPSIISGEPGAGKSTIALEMSICVAAGVPWNGRPVKQREVLYATAEDSYGALQARARAFAFHMGLNLSELPLKLWALPGHDVSIVTINDDGDVKGGPFAQPLAKVLSGMHEPWTILDTQTDFSRLNGNFAAPVNTFLKVILGGLSRLTGGPITVIDHPTKGAQQAVEATGNSRYGLGGSMKWSGSVRSALYVRRDPQDEGRVTVSNLKLSYGQKQEIELRQVGTLLIPIAEEAAQAVQGRLADAVVEVAVEAAMEHHQPIKGRLDPKDWRMLEISRRVGRKPKWDEIKAALGNAQHAGRISYVNGSNQTAAGYYPGRYDEALETAQEQWREARNSSDREARKARKAAGGSDVGG